MKLPIPSLLITAAALLLGALAAPARADILYVSSYTSHAIEKFTSSGGVSIFASSGSRSPYGLAFDFAGNLYAANFGAGIDKFTPGGVRSVFASSGLNGAFGLAFDSAGNLYAANFGDSTIVKFTPGGVGSVFASTGLSNPRYLAFTDDAGVPLNSLLNYLKMPHAKVAKVAKSL